MTRLFAVWVVALTAAMAQQNPGTFPAMQRKPADPEVIARGQAVFGVNCVPCHGADARGGQLNGPNLLRSQLVLADQEGERIEPVIREGRPERGMPAFPLGAEDVKAIVEFIHSLTAASPGQGAPPRAEAPPPDIVVGDAQAGRAYFAGHCAPCHSPDGDLRGIATRVPDAKALQNLWVSGGETARGGRGRGRGGDLAGPAVTATVTPRGGGSVQGRLVFIDDFEIKIVDESGALRSFAREGAVPRVVIDDPLSTHKELLSALTDTAMRDVTAYLVTLK
jgi:cytochrome c oxidase cbb3-type subunit 3